MLKERIKHLFCLMAPTMVTEELPETSEVPLTPLTVQDGGTPPRDGGLETASSCFSMDQSPCLSERVSERECTEEGHLRIVLN